MDSKLRIGVIGAGNMGKHHIRNYSEMDNVELVAIADPNPLSTKLAEAHNAKYFADFNDLLESCELDAVSIVVPTPMHHEIASNTIQRGIHTLLEKPISSTAEEALDLIKKAKEAGVVFTVGHIERFNPVIKTLKELIDTGKLGRLSSIVSQRLGDFPTNEPKSDVILDLAIHDIDIFNYLTGSSGEIIGVHGSRTFHSREIDSAEILLKYKGTSGFIQANWVTPVKIRRITLTGSNGYVEADYVTQEIKFYDSNVAEDLDNFADFVTQFSNPNTITLVVEKFEPLRKELDAFTSACMGGDSSLLVDPIDALNALESALKAGESITNLELVSND